MPTQREAQEFSRKLMVAKQMVQTDADKPHLDKRTIAIMYDVLTERCKPEYEFMLKANRRIRREVGEADIETYAKTVVQASDEIERLLGEGMIWMLSELKVSDKRFEDSNEHYIRQNPRFALMGIMMLEEMRNGIKSESDSPMTLERLVEIYEFQVNEYPRIQLIRPVDEPRLVKQSILSDRVKQRFGVEEEDLQRDRSLRESPRVMQLAQQLKEVCMH